MYPKYVKVSNYLLAALLWALLCLTFSSGNFKRGFGPANLLWIPHHASCVVVWCILGNMQPAFQSLAEFGVETFGKKPWTCGIIVLPNVRFCGICWWCWWRLLLLWFRNQIPVMVADVETGVETADHISEGFDRYQMESVTFRIFVFGHKLPYVGTSFSCIVQIVCISKKRNYTRYKPKHER